MAIFEFPTWIRTILPFGATSRHRKANAAGENEPDGPPMHIEAGVATDAGCLRERNEDGIFYFQPDDKAIVTQRGILAVVADGMGGHQAGEIASRMAIDIVRRVYYGAGRGTNPAARLEQALLAANREIHRAASQDPAYNSMGTTCTALVIRGQSAYCAHVGDSRLYLVRNTRAHRMTEDHSLVMELVKDGVITAEQASHHPDRNVLLRALGPSPQVEVAVWEQAMPVRDGDAFILCSDGLHDLVGDNEISAAAITLPSRDACAHLIGLARERGGYDNISVGILKLGTHAASEQEAETRFLSTARVN
jgi:serine/threonine protein phosphatase PrpC